MSLLWSTLSESRLSVRMRMKFSAVTAVRIPFMAGRSIKKTTDNDQETATIIFFAKGIFLMDGPLPEYRKMPATASEHHAGSVFSVLRKSAVAASPEMKAASLNFHVAENSRARARYMAEVSAEHRRSINWSGLAFCRQRTLQSIKRKKFNPQ